LSIRLFNFHLKVVYPRWKALNVPNAVYFCPPPTPDHTQQVKNAEALRVTALVRLEAILLLLVFSRGLCGSGLALGVVAISGLPCPHESVLTASEDRLTLEGTISAKVED
jgi:hypothetical protein